MKKTYDTILFDLDGTLLDTLDDLTDATNYALREMGFPERSREEVCSFVGNGIYRQIGRAVPEGTDEDTLNRTIEIYRARYSEHNCEKTDLYPGIRELLSALSEKGCRMAVVSNKYDAAVKDMCKKYLSPWISTALGENMPARRKKPAPDSLFDAMKELGAEKERCIYVGDSDVDLETAKNAGIPCIACAWGFRGREFLLSHGAEIVIDTPGELLLHL